MKNVNEFTKRIEKDLVIIQYDGMYYFLTINYLPIAEYLHFSDAVKRYTFLNSKKRLKMFLDGKYKKYEDEKILRRPNFKYLM